MLTLELWAYKTRSKLFDIFCKLIWEKIENMKNNSYGNYGNRGLLETNPVAVQLLVIIKDVLTTP